MTILNDIRRRTRHALGPMIGAAAVAYFGFHAVQGERGLIAWWNLRKEISRAEVTLQMVSARRAELEHRVALLRPDNLDPDLLEERARFMVNVGREGDRVILTPVE